MKTEPRTPAELMKNFWSIPRERPLEKMKMTFGRETLAVRFYDGPDGAMIEIAHPQSPEQMVTGYPADVVRRAMQPGDAEAYPKEHAAYLESRKGRK